MFFLRVYGLQAQRESCSYDPCLLCRVVLDLRPYDSVAFIAEFGNRTRAIKYRFAIDTRDPIRRSRLNREVTGRESAI